MDNWAWPGMERISFLMPSPGTTNKGKMNCEGASRVSRTNRRIDSDERSRRGRCTGNDMTLPFQYEGRQTLQ
jgi:hypothetical protein